MSLTNERTSKSALAPGMQCSITLHPGGRSVSYEVIQLIGRGANSELYLGHDSGQNVCVLKAALPKAGLIDEADLRIAERILEQLSHENLVRYLGSGRTESGRRVLAYERVQPNPSLLLNGQPARGYFHHPDTRYYPLPAPIALSLSIDVFRGLEYMHAQGFVHHDVKPANVMVRTSRCLHPVPTHEVLREVYEGKARGVLVDIGGSRSMDYLEDLNRGVIDPSVVPPQLTLVFAPPEALAAEPGERRRLLPSLDLYAAALVVYSFVTGRAPYDSVGDASQWSALQQLKRKEAQGELSPISLEAIEAVQDGALLAGPLYDFLRACTDRRVEKRPGLGVARRHLEELAAWHAERSTQGAAQGARAGPPPELGWFFSRSRARAPLAGEEA